MKRSVVNQFALANIATEELLRKAELQAAQQRAIQEAAKKSLEAVAALRAGAPRPPPPPPSASLEEAPSSKKRSRPADIDIINEVCLRAVILWLSQLEAVVCAGLSLSFLPHPLLPASCAYHGDLAIQRTWGVLLVCLAARRSRQPLAKVASPRLWRLTSTLGAFRRLLCLLVCLVMLSRRSSVSGEERTSGLWGCSSARSRQRRSEGGQLFSRVPVSWKRVSPCAHTWGPTAMTQNCLMTDCTQRSWLGAPRTPQKTTDDKIGTWGSVCVCVGIETGKWRKTQDKRGSYTRRQGLAVHPCK